MNNDTRMSDVVDGYRVLAEELATRWSDLASTIAAKIDADDYDGKAMFDAWAKATRLSAETGIALWSEALDAAAILSGRQYEPDPVDSQEYESPLPGATLELEEPLVGVDTGARLPAEVRPAELGDEEVIFIVHANATGFPGDVYVGTVHASRGGESEPVEVNINVA